ncbi:MAG: CCA tRNA nucleotidyltransferase [Rickettsiales bacterium]|nr:CCA tRNA nucleotidyltransferase [Rickettsiales bacterium]
MFFSIKKSNVKDIFTTELKYLFSILIKNGDEARLVGGCVRNFLLNIPINDYDIATKYTPDELENILKQNNVTYFTVGKRFGTITAVINNQNFEITTLRKDIETDGRHTKVQFTTDYEEDAERRDFTFNALYVDYDGKIYDYFDGINDLKNGTIKFIGNAENRILEDHLRIMRFFRFYSLYCVDMDYNNLLDCIKHKETIKKLSKERISEEFFKILESPYSVKTLELSQRHNILKEIIDNKIELNFYNLEIFYSINTFINFNHNYLFILCLLLSKNNFSTELILKNTDKKYIETILNNTPCELNTFEIKKLLFRLNDKKIVKDIIVLYHCNNFINFNSLQNDLITLEKLNIPTMNIRGKDLMEAGFTDHKNFSKIIEKIKTNFIESNFSLTKEELINTIH